MSGTTLVSLADVAEAVVTALATKTWMQPRDREEISAEVIRLLRLGPDTKDSDRGTR